MRALTIELLRFGGAPGILRKGDRYLAIAGEKIPPRQIEMPLDHAEFLDCLFDLRYPDDVKPDNEKTAMSTLSNAVLDILRIPKDLDEPIQIDLVTSAAELWALPFESLLNHPDFLLDNKKIVITRRIRQEFLDEKIKWPVQPRLLFAYATPDWVAAEDVPADRHKAALREALKPWIEPLIIPDFKDAVPDENSVLTILRDASLSDIGSAMSTARLNRKPYTHIHVLAHGIPSVDPNRPHRSKFGIALESPDGKPTPPESIAEVLKPEDGLPICVSLAVCDGGNQSNSIVPGSVAQTLHENGIPIVIASQLPLTMDGSVTLAETFYKQLLNGDDVRDAIYAARLAISKRLGTGHDWMSLVTYVQLPEGYADYLSDSTLKRQLASLRTVQKWVDHIVQNKIDSPFALEHVQSTLHDRITSLQSLEANFSKNGKYSEGLYEEITGLLGSAYKRKAELEHYQSNVEVTNLEKWRNASFESLEKSRAYYKKGHDYNLSAHWNGIQHLSLEVALTGKIEKAEYWQTTKLAAEHAMGNERDYWVCGTLAELYLLTPLSINEPMWAKARESLEEMKRRVDKYADDKQFPLETTRRQLLRYVLWWTKENGFFENRKKDLSTEAKDLIKNF